MTASFAAYIDESGDEGFVYMPGEKGSSRWLVLSAIVFRKNKDLEAVRVIRDCHWSLQTLRLPASPVLTNKVQKGHHNGQKSKNQLICEPHCRFSGIKHSAGLAQRGRWLSVLDDCATQMRFDVTVPSF
jgi:Protein of unknown function (DUF3800)